VYQSAKTGLALFKAGRPKFSLSEKIEYSKI